jgi:F0F1-type ATP synthase assembly protein I
MIEYKPADKKKSMNPPSYLRYLGLSMQLFVIIGGGTGLGWWIDQQTEMKFPLWLFIFCFLAVFVGFYHLWISVKNDR